MNEKTGISEFVAQLENLGYKPSTSENKAVFDYNVIAGRFKGEGIRIGLEIPQDFPLTPPSGPHISPQLLPINAGASSHPDKVLPDQNNFTGEFGGEWEYWSRPIPSWQNSDRTVKAYLRHIHNLFSTIR